LDSFLDTYNIYDRIKKLQKLHELKKETEFFKKEIEIYNQQYQELFSDEKVWKNLPENNIN
jgi:hypothetical protein